MRNNVHNMTQLCAITYTQSKVPSQTNLQHSLATSQCSRQHVTDSQFGTSSHISTNDHSFPLAPDLQKILGKFLSLA